MSTTTPEQATRDAQSIDAINDYIKGNPDVTIGVRVTWRLAENSASVPMHIFNAIGVTTQMLMQPELWFYELIKDLRGIFELQAFGADSKPIGGVFKLKRDTGRDHGELNIAAIFAPGWQGPPANGVRVPALLRDKVTGQPIPPQLATTAPTPLFVPPLVPPQGHSGATADPGTLQAYNAAAAENAQLRQNQEALKRELDRLREDGIKREADEKRRAEVEAVRRESDKRVEDLRSEMRALQALQARPAEPVARGPNITEIVTAIGTVFAGLTSSIAPTIMEMRKDAAARDERSREQERLAREEANRRADEATKRAEAAAKAQHELTLEMIRKPADTGNAKMFESMVTVQSQVTQSMLQLLEMKSQYEGNDATPAWMPLAEKMAGTAEKLLLAQQVKGNQDRVIMANIAKEKLETERRAKLVAAARIQQVPNAPKPPAAPAASASAPTQAATPPAQAPPAAPAGPEVISISIAKLLKMSIMSHGDPAQIAKVIVEALKGDRPEYLAFQEELETVYQDDYELMLQTELGDEWMKTPANVYYLLKLKEVVEAAVAAEPELRMDDEEDGEEEEEHEAAAEAVIEAQVVAPVVNGAVTEKPKRQRKAKAVEPTSN